MCGKPCGMIYWQQKEARLITVLSSEERQRHKRMITQIEIDGFKTFKDFKVELAPFQVIVGPNGSGKSNLFDALQLLSLLADHDLYEAFQGIRGDASDLFTR